MQNKESKTSWHFKISILKSVVRIMAGFTLLNDNIVIAGLLIIIAELFGIMEEF